MASMFKDITINMTTSICKCEEDKLTWSPGQEIINNTVRWTLIIGCSGCGTKLTVSEKNLRARFAFDKKPSQVKSEKKTTGGSTDTISNVKAESTSSTTVVAKEETDAAEGS